MKHKYMKHEYIGIIWLYGYTDTEIQRYNKRIKGRRRKEKEGEIVLVISHERVDLLLYQEWSMLYAQIYIDIV